MKRKKPELPKLPTQKPRVTYTPVPDGVFVDGAPVSPPAPAPTTEPREDEG